MREEIYTISGMSCASCSAAVERVTRKLEGVESSSVNLATGRMTILYDENRLGPENIIAKVEKAGFGAELYTPDSADSSPLDDDISSRKKDLIGACILSALLLYVSMGQMMIKGLPVPAFADMHSSPMGFALTQLVLTVPVLYFGRRFFINGLGSLIHLNPNMDSLVAIGSGCSFLYSLGSLMLIPGDHSHAHDLYFESAAV
ncbi:MAG: cation-translocating P-type ATPase, partial [Oscillospiraceae bacterium]|nr:cation-translocating P-type ATPase [Oscillospiraceae bacterium]